MDSRPWAQPLSFLGFGLAGINSLLMLYQLDDGFSPVSHLHLACFLLAVTLAHGVAHLSNFRTYRRRNALFAIGTYLATFGLSAAGIATVTAALA
ncbi:MAG TPA: hypothetical protein VL968_01035 [Rhodocyclaceae bacterium]|jgi:hypothetical protein|nr:hypothetical protein [Rhodocyclaceae bacterium]